METIAPVSFGSGPIVREDAAPLYATRASRLVRREGVENQLRCLLGYSKRDGATLVWNVGLQVAAPYIKNGTVLFHRHGCEQLLAQVFNLGVEAHDDLCDRLTTLLNGPASEGIDLSKIPWIDT